ncbi:hypothetical protein GCM10011492_31320 [Flexivirga endophytica]|uniref:Lipoprotein n=1 Tax=Flexivirga endophytica TaxID=1849103 RepID=A0A916TBJ9_9MICO|nr:hypothetical protein [Flexivirga endophytica]GGB38310.1 hypothetical protein GCM10011492_31320 [Flexivirga endophytica]GHB46297.1 hypothetical protein GCM10008112_13710 [Flexivirga endophytica]
MKIATRTAAAALLISMPMALGACGSDSKPAKADVKAGYIKAVKKNMGASGAKVPDSLYKKMADCIVDESYDDVSADTLNKLKDGNVTKDTKVKSEDKDTMDKASKTCQTKLADDFKSVG